MKIKSSLVIYILMGITTSLFAQNDLRQDSVFFKETLTDYLDWMDRSGIATILEFDTLTIDSNLIAMHFYTANAESWFALRNEYQSKMHQHIGEAMFHKLLFQMEVGRDSAVMIIVAKNSGYTITISNEEDEVKVGELLPDAVAKNNGIQVKLGMEATDNTMRTRRSKEQVRILITNYFGQYYEEKEVWWSKSKYEAIKYGDILSLEISNIKREILHDFLIGYFELININIYLEQKGELLEITYHLQGKYGSGVFVAPRRSGYKDMDKNYEEYLKRYERWLHFQLEQILTSKVIKN